MSKKSDIETRLQAIGWLLGFLSILIFGSLIGYDSTEDPWAGLSDPQNINNPFNIVGVFISFFLIKIGFGYASYIFPLIGLIISFHLISNFRFELYRIVRYAIIFLLLSSLTLGLIENLDTAESPISMEYSGVLGGSVLNLLYDWISVFGAIGLVSLLWLLLIGNFFRLDYYELVTSFALFVKKRFSSISFEGLVPKKEVSESSKIIENESFLDDIPKNLEHQDEDDDFVDKESFEEVDDVLSEDENDEDSLSIEKAIIEKEIDIDKNREKSIIKKNWKFPSVDLLESVVGDSEDLSNDYLKERAEFLRASISTFGVEGKTGSIKTGPIITLFEIEPSEGVRVNKFVQLSDDIARVMEADRVRVIAPIPGTSLVGVEIPNNDPQTIYLKSVINSEKYDKSSAKLKLAIGKGTLGDIAILDLGEMPHLLIAGTTGSGKSVSLNTIIVSLLYQLKPEELKFVIIDPKKVEMSLYKGLQEHYLLKFDGIDESIITKKDNAILALRSLEKEMDSRYDLLANEGKRNISEYNESMKKKGNDLMPYIVLVVDELADLMMYSPRDVEAPIARLAQLARAVGIHLVIATQRPSVDVITGVIKANFAARIAFQVASKIDSRTIIDAVGADKLIGKGDMLYQKPGSSSPVRLHGAFITLKEIEDVVGYISQQPKPTELILETVKDTSSVLNSNEDGLNDELLNKAIEIIVVSKQASISLLQRRLSIGYSRAARLIDEMERLQIVGPFSGSKAREILVDESYLETIKDDDEEI